MKKLTLLFVFNLIFVFGNHWGSSLQAQWIAQTPPSGTTSLYSVFAIDTNTVACAGAGRVIRSNDGGTTWTAPIQLGGVNLYTIHSGINTNWLSLSSNTGWMVKVTSTGGVNLSYGAIDSVMAVHFNTSSCATAVGLVGKIETTCDSGATWTVRSFTGLALNSVWYANTNIGVACGVFGSIKRTLDAGATWASVTCPVSQNLNAVTFADSATGYIVGNSGTFLKTIDGGATWTSMPLSITNNINGVYFVSPDTGFIVGAGGLIKRTVNGGVSWTSMSSGTTQILRSVHFTNSVTGWVCGDGAVLLKYCPTLAASGSITGSTTVCAGDTITYTAPLVAGANNYTWSTPTGWSGGSTTNTISLVAGYTSGNINFAANNSCGAGTPISLAVTVNSPPVPIITQSYSTLFSSASSGNQWYLNGSPIAGATASSYAFTSNGSYTVVVSANGCSSTSLPRVITNAGIENTNEANTDFTVYPNPAKDFIHVTVLSKQFTKLKLTDVLGNTMLESTINNAESNIDIRQFAKGIYFIQLLDDKNSIRTRKILVQ